MPASNIQESELLEKLVVRDEQAFSRIYALYFDKVCNYALRIVKSPHLAEDVAQETFIKLWEQCEYILTDRPLRPYLFTLTKNACLNVIRRASRETSIADEIIDHAIAQSENGLEYTSSKQAAGIFRLAVSNLPPKRLAIYDLCRNHGYSYKQTAEKLGIKGSTVNSQMVKALKFIKEFMVKNDALLIFTAGIIAMLSSAFSFQRFF